MKIFIVCSRYLYSNVPRIKEMLENSGHEITLPNNYEAPSTENSLKEKDYEYYTKWKAQMLREQGNKVSKNDAVLVLNFDKNNQSNYIGGATFLEMFKAWELGKKIFLINPIPDNMLKDEITGLSPIILNGDLSKIK